MTTAEDEVAQSVFGAGEAMGLVSDSQANGSHQPAPAPAEAGQAVEEGDGGEAMEGVASIALLPSGAISGHFIRLPDSICYGLQGTRGKTTLLVWLKRNMGIRKYCSLLNVSSSQPTENSSQLKVLKSGNLLLSSKGIGWTVWKKRWFILTRTSLVFFRSDPNIPPPRGSEPIVTLGGIDLNNTASMIVKEERKIITVVFPDVRDGRTFTLKAETTEDLNEWRSALENALAHAPSVVNTADDKSVIGRPAEFALVDADGTTAFLEKALKFIEDYGKNEFSPEEDGHVIGDCIKYILREMPSSPVPAACCTALVKAYRTDKTRRLDAMNRVIYEVFPEPNRQLLQRILKMMQIVGSHKAVNRMSSSALAACMAPLLLRPLLLGECEIDSDFSMAGDGSLQLLQAAAAANHAQAIVIIMLEEYDQIFDDIEDGSCSSDAYTESDIDKEYSTDNDIPEDDGSFGSGEDDAEEDLNDNTEHSSGSRGKCDSNIRIGNADDQVRENTVMQKSLERRKEALHERRVTLEKEVENLRDQLQKERSLRVSLESGLMNMRRGQVSFPSTIDSKTKADLEEVAATEADIMNLKQKVSDLRGQLNNQTQLSSTSLCESCNNKRLLNADKLVEGEQNAALSTEISSSVKAPPTVGSNSVPDMFWATNQMVQKMLSSKDGQDGSLAARWNFAQRPYSNTHSSTKTEESGVAPSSALAKLTNRLNFLKERRALLASEMQNLDLGRPHAQGPTAPPKRDSS
ncbi:Rho GTPase-activating protein REN1 [Dichanthelium oligosanthes]|uniref:Rho GTPase-activating protein REN1 n=1 Tax=Dichanthelium oligosanthes TaxID=888268 RepID=A0A1E5WHC0_9POAL|nr:Rho GTPase-activating protein REN1 [Dichanthelium oligosanthes]